MMSTVITGSFGRCVQSVQRLWDRHCFQRRRIDYYDYLSSLLAGMDGSRTLKDVFHQDALRYGPSSLRGRLSRSWLATYQRAGGDLYATWEAHMPRTELLMIRAAQSLGNQALTDTLQELSVILRLLQDAARILNGTLWPAVLALCVALSISLAVPWFTVPRLMDTFATVPADYYGSLTEGLITFSSIVGDYYFVFIGVVVISTGFVIGSLPHAAGPVRRFLDNYLWWNVYRNISALRFLSFLQISLGDEIVSSVQLRGALLRMRSGASSWLSSHIDEMLERIDQGIAGPETFDTGLFDREQFWFLSDMILARGLFTGLSLTRTRIQRHVLVVVARQAVVMRWGVLLACVAYVLGLTLWHYAVIDELRRALMFYFSN